MDITRVIGGIEYSYIDPEPLPDSAKLARLVGSIHYDTGEPCKRGHHARRYTPTRQCMECDRERKEREKGAPSGEPRAAWLTRMGRASQK